MKYALIVTESDDAVRTLLETYINNGAEEIVLLSNDDRPAAKRQLIDMQSRAQSVNVEMQLIFRDYDTFMQGFAILAKYLAGDDFFIAPAMPIDPERVGEMVAALQEGEGDAVVAMAREGCAPMAGDGDGSEGGPLCFCLKPIAIMSLLELDGLKRGDDVGAMAFVERMKKDGLNVTQRYFE